jgi:hypothetical protein
VKAQLAQARAQAQAQQLRRGFVLVAVLGGILIVGAVAFAMLFTASLESMAVRARQDSVIARAALDGALTLTVAELAAGLADLPGEGEAAGDQALESSDHGPWPEHGLPVLVAVERVPTDDGSVVVRLTATHQPAAGAQRATESVIVRLQPDLQLLRR